MFFPERLGSSAALAHRPVEQRGFTCSCFIQCAIVYHLLFILTRNESQIGLWNLLEAASVS